jgi:hypothetical protein
MQFFHMHIFGFEELLANMFVRTERGSNRRLERTAQWGDL